MRPPHKSLISLSLGLFFFLIHGGYCTEKKKLKLETVRIFKKNLYQNI